MLPAISPFPKLGANGIRNSAIVLLAFVRDTIGEVINMRVSEMVKGHLRIHTL